MRAAPLLVALLALHLVPAAHATPTCVVAEQTQPTPLGLLAVRTASCHDATTVGTATYQVWSNQTRVSLHNGTSPGAVVVLEETHYLATDGDYEYDQHARSLFVLANAGVVSADASLASYHAEENGVCGETTVIGVNYNAPAGPGGAYQYLFGGAGRALPCVGLLSLP